MTEIQVREATSTDTPALTELYQRRYQETCYSQYCSLIENVTESQIENWIHCFRMLVVTVDGTVSGGARLDRTGDSRVKFSRLLIRGDATEPGLGTRLLEHAETLLRNEGYGSIWLVTPPDHPFLPQMYRRRGYEEVGVCPPEYRHYERVIVEKRLR